VLTARNAIAEWVWHYARKRHKNPRDSLWLLKKNLRPWFSHDLRLKRRRDAVQLLDGIVRRGAPVEANRFCQMAGQMCKFLIRDRAWDEKGLDLNPFADIQAPGGAEGSRERVLEAHEIRVYWQALADPAAQVAQERIRLGLQLILVTGQRGGEVRKSKPGDFDLKARRWTIHDTKNGHEHVVPLTDLAVEIVERLLVLSVNCKYLIPHRHKAKCATKPIGKHTFARALRNLRYGKKHGKRGQRPKRLHDGPLAKLEPFTPHDSRRTVVTNLADLGVSRFTIKRIINHRKKKKSKPTDVTEIYDRHDYWGRKLRALKKWDRRLQRIIGREQVAVPLAA
jgi:integrase